MVANGGIEVAFTTNLSSISTDSYEIPSILIHAQELLDSRMYGGRSSAPKAQDAKISEANVLALEGASVKCTYLGPETSCMHVLQWHSWVLLWEMLRRLPGISGLLQGSSTSLQEIQKCQCEKWNIGSNFQIMTDLSNRSYQRSIKAHL